MEATCDTGRTRVPVDSVNTRSLIGKLPEVSTSHSMSILFSMAPTALRLGSKIGPLDVNPDKTMLTWSAAHILEIVVLGFNLTVMVSSAPGCTVDGVHLKLLLLRSTPWIMGATEMFASNQTCSIESGAAAALDVTADDPVTTYPGKLVADVVYLPSSLFQIMLVVGAKKRSTSIAK